MAIQKQAASKPKRHLVCISLRESTKVKLDELRLSENTIFVFTSDNGGLHVPEGGHERVTHNTPFRAGKGYTYEGGQRVPLIVRWPGHIPEGRVIDTPVNNIDWIPTLMELAGAPMPSGLDGVSFANGLTGGTIPERKLFWHFPHYTNQGGRPSGAVRDGKWIMVEYYDEQKTELYNLSTDISEQQDQAEQYPDRVAAMWAALDGWRRENDVQYNTSNPSCDEKKYKRLYVDVDASTFDPLVADEAGWARMQTWRREMNEAIRTK